MVLVAVVSHTSIYPLVLLPSLIKLASRGDLSQVRRLASCAVGVLFILTAVNHFTFGTTWMSRTWGTMWVYRTAQG